MIKNINTQFKVFFMTVLPPILAAVTGLVLLVHFPTQAMLDQYLFQTVVYTALIGFAVLLGAFLSGRILSTAHTIGIVFFLTLPEGAFNLMVWGVFIGSLLGGALRLLQTRQSLRDLAFIFSSVTLSFYVAGRVYWFLDGPLPLQMASWDAYDNLPLLVIIYVLVYVIVYLAIFMLELYCTIYDLVAFLRSNKYEILQAVFLPVPFAVISANVMHDLKTSIGLMGLFGLMVIISGLFVLTRSEASTNRRFRELQTVSSVTHGMRAKLELDELLRIIYEQIHQLLNVDNFKIVLYEADRERYTIALEVRQGEYIDQPLFDHDTLPHPYVNTLEGHVLAMGQPLLLERDVHAVARSLKIEPPKDDVYSWMGVPLLVRNHNLGVMAVSSQLPMQIFDEDDLHIMKIVADSASAAIENAQLYAQQQHRLLQMMTLSNIVEMLSGTLSPETVLDTVISSASALTQATAVAIYLFSEDSALRLTRSAGLSDYFVYDPPKPLLLQQDDGLHLQKPLLIGDVTTDERASHLRKMLTRERKQSFIELSLNIGENSLGVLVIYFDTVQYFTGEYLELFRTFATQVAQSISNAHIYTRTDLAFQRSVEQLLVLKDVGNLLTSTMNLNEICAIILAQVIDVTKADIGMVVLLTDDGYHVDVVEYRGYNMENIRNSYLIQRGIGKVALDTGKVQRIDDVSEDQNYYQMVDDMRSQLTVPILQGRTRLGYITLESKEIAGFPIEDTHFISQIANQAVIAINNARLFKRISEARDRLQIILDTIDEAVILIDRNGQVVLVNPRVRMLGLEPADLIERYLGDLLRDAELNLAEHLGFESVQEMSRLFFDLGKSDDWLGENQSKLFVTQQDSISVQRYVISAYGEKGQIIGALLVFYDRTEEQEIGRAREELSRMLVHDLRSPLTAVTTSLRLLNELVPEESSFFEMVKMTTDASNRAVRKLLGRVNSLLDIARMESGKLDVDPDYVELPAIIEGVFAELQPLAHDIEVELKTDFKDDIPLLYVDSDKVERLLLNLVDNALKYSNMNKEVIIRTFAPGTYGTPKGFMRIDIVDQGPGIPDEYKTVLFDRFAQIDGRQRVRQGVGLGLTFCKLVTEAHGGKIWIEDNPEDGGGSVFSLHLPIADLTRLPE